MTAAEPVGSSRSGSLTGLALYFLRLGAIGFGGPIALVGYMHRDLVDERAWLTEEEYQQGLALAQLAPGPLAAQLAIYIGWVRNGVLGASLIGFAFVVPSFLMVLALGAAYVRYGGLPWMRGAFYGIGAAVIAIIARSALKLVKTTLKADRLLWSVFAVMGVATALTETEIIWLFLLAGVAVMAFKAPPRLGAAPVFAWPVWLFTGLHGPAELSLLAKLLGYFALAGSVVFGSGLAIVPFLHGGVVDQNHWLTERQFLDAVAVAMITPGPVVITVAFIGYLVAGPVGAVIAAAGVFLPCYFFVVIPAKHYHRYAKQPSVAAFVSGITAAATGAIAGAVVVLARRAVFDLPTALIALLALGVLFLPKKVPEPLIVLASGLAGILIAGNAIQAVGK